MRLLVSLPQNAFPFHLPDAFARAFPVETQEIAYTPHTLGAGDDVFSLGVGCAFSKNYGALKAEVFYAKRQASFAPESALGLILSSKLVHGVDFVVHTWPNIPDLAEPPAADGLILVTSAEIKQPQALMMKTADCLPLVYAYPTTTQNIFALVHAGWRGLSLGIVGKGVDKIRNIVEQSGEIFNPGGLVVYLGPAIFGRSYQCRKDVWQPLVAHRDGLGLSPEHHELYTTLCDVEPNDGPETLLCFPDLQLLAALELDSLGVKDISILRENTYTHPHLCSFRGASHGGGDVKERFDTIVKVSKPILSREG